MSAAACVNSRFRNLSRTTKKAARNACPLLSPWEAYFALLISQSILFVRGLFEAILLPLLTDGDSGEGLVGAVQRRDRPLWSDYLR